MRHALLTLLIMLVAVLPAHAVNYEVGPGQPLAAIADVPWDTLAPGDVVLIHWRASPYREKWAIGTTGAPGAPLTVRGVPAPDGSLPVIDGDGAVTPLQLDYWNENRSVIKIGGTSVPASGFPEHVVIENLEIRSARPPYTFTDDRGNPAGYADNAASIHVEQGRHVTIRNCVLHDSGNGLFVSSADAWASSDILVEGCHLFDNGITDSIYQHNNYTEALGITFQYNWFGPPRAGALGNNLKDRSAGLIVRYNWIEGGNRQLDLVDAEGSTILVNDPSYRETYVYGNVFVETEGSGNRQVLHYGGDSGTTADYRKGTLHFYNNTVVSLRTDRTTLMRLSTNEERCDARNNVVHVRDAGGDTLSLLDASGVLDWSHAWTKPGWVDTFGTLDGTLNDDGTSLSGAAPGFLDEAGLDLHLDAASPCRDSGTTLAPGITPEHEPLQAYGKHQGQEARGDSGPLDIGAYAAGCAPEPAPGPVSGVRWLDAETLAWDPAADATTYDAVKGDLGGLASSGLTSSVLICLESDDTDTTALDATRPGSGRGFTYLVRGRNCGGGPGSWGTARDAALEASPATCP